MAIRTSEWISNIGCITLIAHWKRNLSTSNGSGRRYGEISIQLQCIIMVHIFDLPLIERDSEACGSTI
jgi:hypothetical protein